MALVIAPTSGWAAPNWAEMWRYRDLLAIFVWRDLKVRYKRTVIGAGWAVLQPLIAMVVFSLVFGRLAHLPSDDVPYPIFSFAALVPWTLFANAVGGATTAVVTHSNIISKVYFPRLFLPLSPVIGALVDFGIALVVLLGMMVFFGIHPGPQIITLPLFTAFAVLAAAAVGIWLAALNALFQDVRYALPFLMQVWLYASPVAYATSLVPPEWRAVYGLNPMATVIEGFRWALLGSGQPPDSMAAVSVLVVALLLVSGLFFFRRVERIFADVV